MATSGEAEPSRAGGTNYEYSCIHEPIGLPTVVPFKRSLVEVSEHAVTLLWCIHGHGSNLNLFSLYWESIHMRVHHRKNSTKQSTVTTMEMQMLLTIEQEKAHHESHEHRWESAYIYVNMFRNQLCFLN